MIDTLTLKEKFENNGFSASQASTLSHAMNDLTKDKDQLATKDELHQVRNELKIEIKEVKSEIRDLRAQMISFWNCMKELRKEMTKDMEQLESRLLHKLTYTTVISQISIGTILVTLMIYFHQNP
jgi:predicted  nucleic acid-binding Zn-ribbon protein